jgi:hypothetical protein
VWYYADRPSEKEVQERAITAEFQQGEYSACRLVPKGPLERVIRSMTQRIADGVYAQDLANWKMAHRVTYGDDHPQGVDPSLGNLVMPVSPFVDSQDSDLNTVREVFRVDHPEPLLVRFEADAIDQLCEAAEAFVVEVFAKWELINGHRLVEVLPMEFRIAASLVLGCRMEDLPPAEDAREIVPINGDEGEGEPDLAKGEREVVRTRVSSCSNPVPCTKPFGSKCGCRWRWVAIDTPVVQEEEEEDGEEEEEEEDEEEEVRLVKKPRSS